ncbi:FtsH protease activity modulator HflK [Glacieibacterium sp.]|uniref:FtsH protease activity modulator HflK n=1 Tax=Glacieibacterium sp. TaxID=2860237 RepID=UPI003B009511
MPWQNNNDSGGAGGGGPWGGSGGGAGGGSGDGGKGSGGSGGPPKSPWGEGPPRRPNRGPNRGNVTDFDAFIRRSQEKLRGSLPGGNGGGGGGFMPSNRMWSLGIAAVLGLWVVLTSTYRVDPQERGVVMRFGRYVETTDPGFHFKLPSPIDTVIKPPVEQIRSVDIGGTDGSAENLMLTGDQNIIDIAYAVRWKIKNPELFLFELAEPEQTIREVAESAMRAEIGHTTLNAAIGPQRAQIADQVRERMQDLLDSYRGGIEVRGVDIKQADPPAAVDEAFKSVSAAQQYAQQALNNSRGYASQLAAVSQGAAAQFDAVYAQYKLAPEVTRKRIYLETMESVLGKVDKTFVEPGGVQAYLPLQELRKRAVPVEDPAATTPSR